MHLEWILNPLVPYIVISAGMVASLALWLSLKAELTAGYRKAEAINNELALQVRELAVAVEDIRRSIANQPERPAANLNRTLNLTKRSQALRMYHRGEPIATIAAALDAPHTEVELMLKLHQAIQQRNN